MVQVMLLIYIIITCTCKIIGNNNVKKIIACYWNESRLDNQVGTAKCYFALFMVFILFI